MNQAAASGKCEEPRFVSQSSLATFLGKGEELPGKCDLLPKGASFFLQPCSSGLFGHVPGLSWARALVLLSKCIFSKYWLEQ